VSKGPTRIRVGAPGEVFEIELVGTDDRVYVLRGAVVRSAELYKTETRAGGKLHVTFEYDHADAGGYAEEPEEHEPEVVSGVDGNTTSKSPRSRGPKRPESSRRATRTVGEDEWPEDMGPRPGQKPWTEPQQYSRPNPHSRPGGPTVNDFEFQNLKDFFRAMGFDRVPPRGARAGMPPGFDPFGFRGRGPRQQHPAGPVPAWRVVLEGPVNLVVAEATYRRLAKTRHPDHGGTHDQMVELNKAIEEARRFWR
jgi:hypothetical protein